MGSLPSSTEALKWVVSASAVLVSFAALVSVGCSGRSERDGRDPNAGGANSADAGQGGNSAGGNSGSTGTTGTGGSSGASGGTTGTGQACGQACDLLASDSCVDETC